MQVECPLTTVTVINWHILLSHLLDYCIPYIPSYIWPRWDMLFATCQLTNETSLSEPLPLLLKWIPIYFSHTGLSDSICSLLYIWPRSEMLFAICHFTNELLWFSSMTSSSMKSYNPYLLVMRRIRLALKKYVQVIILATGAD